MDRRFNGKVVMVTGAGSGLGRAVAIRLAEEGAQLSLIDVDERGLEASNELVLAQAPAAGTLLIPADVSDEQAVRSYVQETLREFRRVDGLYNNAGVDGARDPVEAYDSEEFDRVIAINLKGVFYAMKHTLPHLREQRSGAIVNASSVAGVRAVPDQVAYVASKHAVAGMTKAAAIEYGRYGVSINAVAPGAVMTEMVKATLIGLAGEEGWEQAGADFVSVNPKRRFGEAHEVAGLVAFLLSGEAELINGAVVTIDGGQSHAY